MVESQQATAATVIEDEEVAPKPQEETLTTRQWRLHDLVVEAGYGKALTQKEVCEALPGFYTYNEDNAGTTDACRKLWPDVTKINNSYLTPIVIIVRDYTYRLATPEEAKAYCAHKDKLLRRQHWRLSIIEKKAEMNGQGRLIDFRGHEIVPGSKAALVTDMSGLGGKSE